MRQLVAHIVGKAAVKLHYMKWLDIYSLCSIYEPELYARGQAKQKIPDALRWTVWRRDNFTCVYCLAWGMRLSLDHIVPEVHGGKIEESNLVTACSKCNRKKSDTSFEEFMKSPWLVKKKTQNLRTLTTQGKTIPTVKIPGHILNSKSIGSHFSSKNGK